MKKAYQSYANQQLSESRIALLAKQYEDEDMAELMGADHNNFPFLVTPPKGKSDIMIWNKPKGIIPYHDNDPVRHYATVKYLRENVYPEFESVAEALAYAKKRDWPLEEL